MDTEGLQAGLDYRTPESFEIIDRVVDEPEYQLKSIHPISQDEQQLLRMNDLDTPTKSTPSKRAGFEDPLH